MGDLRSNRALRAVHFAQVAAWIDEVARLKDMSDRLLGFKGKLHVYFDLAYIEAVHEWENEVEKGALPLFIFPGSIKDTQDSTIA